MTDSPISDLRRAAEKLREHAAAVRRDMEANRYWSSSMSWRRTGASTEGEIYAQGVNSGLGGPAGALAAVLTPGAADALADWLDAEAAAHEGGMGVTEAMRDLVAVVSQSEPGVQVAVSTLGQAHAVALAILGEEADQ